VNPIFHGRPNNDMGVGCEGMRTLQKLTEICLIDRLAILFHLFVRIRFSGVPSGDGTQNNSID